MTAAAYNQWSGLFNVGEEFDDEDLLEADWLCASESTSASTSESLKVLTTNIQKNTASSSSIPAGSTPGSLRGPVKTLSSLSIPVHHSLSSSIPSLRAPASSLQPPTGQKNPPSTASCSFLQSELAQDDFDDWDVDLDELDESIPQMVSQPQKISASDRISPAKRMRPSSSSGAQVSSHISFCSTTSMSAVARPSVNISSTLQVPTHLSTPVQIRSHMRGPVTPVSQFPRPLSAKPPVVLSQRWAGPSTPRTPLQPRGSLFHSVSSSPNPSPTLTPRPLSTPVMTNHLVQLVSAANKTPQRPQSSVMRSKARRFPGPAGALPQQVSVRSLDDIVVSVPQTPAHGAVARSRSEGSSSQGSEEEEFSRGPWAVMKAEMGLDEKNPSCFLHSYSVVMVLRKAALRQLAKNKVPNMAVILKSITHTHADAKAIFRDHTGEMQGTVHRRLVEDRQGDLKTGAVLLLKQVGVFSPSHRNHYLNVTPNNLLKIYPPDGVLHNSQISFPPLELVSQCEPEKTAGGPVSRMELHFDDDEEEEEGENTELKRAAAGSDHTAAVSYEVCQAPTGSGPTEDTTWETDDLDELLGELPVESYGGEL